MVLSDTRIIEELEKGNIIIDPFNESQLQSSSYDITIGEWYYEEQEPILFGGIFNPYDQQSIRDVWGNPQLATYYPTTRFEYPTNITKYDKVILLKPGKTYLCHSNEFIGYRNTGTTMMKARSSLGRDFIEVCKCAGWGDVGYINRWTMEVTNNSKHYAIPLKVGTKVAQIIFLETGPTARPYGGLDHYQSELNIDAIKQEWKPLNMLPKVLK